MLDECKGDKFEEVLAAFSTAVVKKLLTAREADFQNAAKKLALAKELNMEEQESLLPLAIAHRASLTKSLRERSELRHHYGALGHMLVEKDGEIEKRSMETSTIATEISKKKATNFENIRLEFKNCWFGDKRWADAILEGGVSQGNDGLLEMSFDDVWNEVGSGIDGETKTQTSRDVLAELDDKVAKQQRRLQRWQSYRDSLRATQNHPEQPIAECPKVNTRLLFRDHQDLRVGALPVQTATANAPSSQAFIMSEYESLVASMHGELAAVSSSKLAPKSEMAKRKNTPISSKTKRWSDEVPGPRDAATSFHKGVDVAGSSKTIPRHSQDEGSPLKPALDPSKHPRPTRVAFGGSISPSLTSVDHGNSLSSEDDERADNLRSQSASQTHLTRAPTSRETRGSVKEVPRQSFTTFVHSAINSPIGPAGKSILPNEHSHHDKKDFDAKPDLPHKPGKQKAIVSADHRVGITLLERTRQSMSMLPNTNTRRRQSMMEKPRQPQSYPTNPLPTPGKPARDVDSEASMPREELFSQEADYASVFKSRPRIAQSPTISPIANTQSLGNFDSRVEEMDDVSLGGIELDSSPIARSKEGLKGF